MLKIDHSEAPWTQPHFCNPSDKVPGGHSKCNCGYVFSEPEGLACEGTVAEVFNRDAIRHKLSEEAKWTADEHPQGTKAVGNGILIAASPELYGFVLAFSQVKTLEELQILQTKFYEFHQIKMIEPFTMRAKNYKLYEKENG